MKNKAVLLMAAMTLITGCSSKTVPQSSPVTGETSSAEEKITSAEASTRDKSKEIVLTMACMTEPWDNMKQWINEFNAEDNGVRIEIKSFGSINDDDGIPHGFTDEELTQIDFQVTQELLNSDDIDLVGPFSFGNGAKFEIFKRKGGFVDLYKLMENDPEVNTDTLNKHILELCESDGKLYSIPTHYWAKTLIGKSEYVGTKQNWTIDEFTDRWEAMPEGSTVNGSVNAENIYYDVLRANTPSFVDYAECQVHFDDPDFRKMLEFCNTFPSNSGQKGEYNYNGEAMVHVEYVNSYQAGLISDMDYNTFENSSARLRDGGYTLVGFPSSDGSGAFLCGTGDVAIRSNISEEKQQAAWEFIRGFYTEEFQTDNYAFCEEFPNPESGETIVQYTFEEGFPINNAARRNIAKNFIDEKYKSNVTDITVQGNEVTQLNELKLEQADCDFIDDYIDSIDRWEYSETDSSLFWIVEEEVLNYLSGGQDIDSTISMIQDRASIWLSEQA
jgi:ABC-type glycerol-3-phosphate transport system substrate-binding protein